MNPCHHGRGPDICMNDALPDSEFCAEHQPRDFWDDVDRIYETRRDDAA